MATPLTEEQKAKKAQQDDLRNRQSTINFPTNIQPGQDVPLMDIAKQPKQALAQAGEMAQTGYASPLQQKTEGIANQILDNPTGINREAELGKFDVDRSKSLEEFRRGTGGIAGSSDRNQELINMFSSGAFDRAQLDAGLQKQEREGLLTSFDIGQRASVQGEQSFRNRVADLLNVSSNAAQFEQLDMTEKIAFAEMASKEKIQLNDQQFQNTANALRQNHEIALQSNDINASRESLLKELSFRENQAALGREFTAEQSAYDRTLKESLAHLDINGQKQMIELKNKLDTNTLLTSQEFEAAQSALDRALENSKIDKNINAQMELQKAQFEFNTLMQESEQKWQTAERNASQMWKTGERLSDNDHQLSVQYLDHQNKVALQSNDIGAQKEIQSMKSDLALKMQTQDMQHGEKLMFLESQYQEAAASKDYERQKSLLKLKTQEQITLLQQEGKQAESLAVLDNELKKSLMGQDFEQSKILQELKHSQEITLQANELQMQQAQLALKEKGLNIDINNMYNQWLQGAIQNGQVSPESGMEWLKQNLPANMKGLINPPNPLAIQTAIKEDFLNQQLQFSLTNKDSAIYDKNGAFIGLKPDALTKFNDWINTNLYKADGAQNTIVQQIISKANSKKVNSSDVKEFGGNKEYAQSNEKPSGLEMA